MIETFPSGIDRENRLKRARMRAWRRGMREMDLILGGYIDAHGDRLDDDGLTALEGILAHRDQDLYAWISGRANNFNEVATGREVALLGEISKTWRSFSG